MIVVECAPECKVDSLHDAEYNTEFHVHSLSVVECAPELQVDSYVLLNITLNFMCIP